MSDLMDYDPNLTEQTGQTVRLTFGCWRARHVATVTVPGGTGWGAIEAAIIVFYDGLPTRTYWTESMPVEVALLELTEPDSEVLVCEDEDQAGESWLLEMLIGAEIVAIGEATAGLLTKT